LSAAAAPGITSLGLRFAKDLIRKISEESRNAGKEFRGRRQSSEGVSGASFT